MSNFIQTLQSLQGGGYSWTDSALVRIGLERIMSKPMIGETHSSAAETNFAYTNGASVSKTIVFTAPVDCTLRNMVFIPPTLVTAVGVYSGVYASVDPSLVMTFGQFTVAGTGPDVGTYVEGFGVPCGIFHAQNAINSPTLNYRMDAGDTLTCTVYAPGPGGLFQHPYDVFVTYDEGQDTTVSPARFVGGAAAPYAEVSLSTAGPASGAITVTGSTSPGDEITIFNQFTGVIPDLTDEAGGTLTGQAGGGASGTNTWDSNTVGITATRDAILTALQDPVNSFGDYTFVSSGGDSITFDKDLEGVFGNYDQFEASGPFTLSPSTGNLGGATATSNTGSLATPSTDITITDVYVGFVFSSFLPGLRFLDTPSLTAVNVGGVPNTSFPVVRASQDLSSWRRSSGFAAVPGSTALSVDVRNPAGPATIQVVAVGY